MDIQQIIAQQVAHERANGLGENVEVLTLDQQIEEARVRHERDRAWNKDLGPFDPQKFHYCDVLIRFEVSNDGYAGIELQLYDTGSYEGSEPKLYDMSFAVHNSDNVGPITMLAQLQAVIEHFYASDLHKRFQLVDDLVLS